LTKAEQDKILDYKVMVYFCEGNDKEKLDWFETINIAGEKLTKQELRNAVYTGTWLSDAKLKFSKSTCIAYKIANNYVNGSPIRQEYLETALRWITDGGDDEKIRDYMAEHHHDPNANELFFYFRAVIDWIENTFTNYRKEMKGLEWGLLYNQYKNKTFDTVELEKEITVLMTDDDVKNKKGIYLYVLDGQEKHLNIRAFENSMKRSAYEKQKGICKKCAKKFTIDQMEADHIIPWSKGGKTTAENCQMLCRDCNRRKSDK
jgi:hypothetical protein